MKQLTTLLDKQTVRVGARSSNLSRMQVQEVFEELVQYDPNIEFVSTFLKTTGDVDQTTSLRLLDKTDFFTKEIDALLLSGEVQIAIHSAKDLPDPLNPGLEVVAITQGVDPSDVLVLRDPGVVEGPMRVGTSSKRREALIRAMYPLAELVDIRGTIEKRLEQLKEGGLDGVVMANAALIRLKLTHHHVLPLPGEPAPMQGRLAVVARRGDEAMKTLFSKIDYENTLPRH